jgi:hypothetical protein
MIDNDAQAPTIDNGAPECLHQNLLHFPIGVKFHADDTVSVCLNRWCADCESWLDGELKMTTVEYWGMIDKGGFGWY